VVLILAFHLGECPVGLAQGRDDQCGDLDQRDCPDQIGPRESRRLCMFWFRASEANRRPVGQLANMSIQTTAPVAASDRVDFAESSA